MSIVFRVIAPLLIHMFVSETAGILLSGRVPPVITAGVVSLAVLPFGIWMIRRDRIYGRRVLPLFSGNFRGRGRIWENSLISVGCFVSGAALNWIFSMLIRLSGLASRFPDSIQTELLKGPVVFQLLFLAVTVPISEELFFRGLVNQRMREYASAPFAVTACSLLFSVYHGNLIQAVFALPMSVILCLICEKRNCLSDLVLFHSGSNLAAVLCAALAVQ